MPKTSIYLPAEDFRELRALAREMGSQSEVVRKGMALLRKRRIWDELSDKYRVEAELSDEVAAVQAEAASDLGEYPW